MENPVHALGKAAAAMRRTVRDFVQLFAAEGRLASHTVIRIIVLSVMGGTFIAIAWLLFCLGLAAQLVDAYDWGWGAALCLVAGVHVLAAIALLVFAKRAASPPFFPRTLAQLQGVTRNGAAGHPSIELRAAAVSAAALRDEMRRYEESLLRSRDEIGAELTRSKRDARALLSHPGVLAGAAVLGLALGLMGSRRRGAATVRRDGLGARLSRLGSAARARAFEARARASDARAGASDARAGALDTRRGGALGKLAAGVGVVMASGVGAQLKRVAVAQLSAQAVRLLAAWLQRRRDADQRTREAADDLSRGGFNPRSPGDMP